MKSRHVILFAVGVTISLVGPATAVPPKPIDATAVTLLPADGTPESLRKMASTFASAITKVNNDANTKRNQLRQHLIDGFDRAITQAQAAGDLDTILALKEAKNQFETLEDSDIALVKNAIAFRDKKTAEIESSRIADALKAAKDFNDELEKAKKSATQQGDFEMAKVFSERQKTIVDWVSSVRASVPTTVSLKPDALHQSSLSATPSSKQTEVSKTLLIDAKNPDGASIGYLKAGSRIRIRYLDGFWTTWTPRMKRKSPDSVGVDEAYRAVLTSKGTRGAVEIKLPPSTKEEPFEFIIQLDGEYALRINDGNNRDLYGDNSGQVRYSIHVSER